MYIPQLSSLNSSRRDYSSTLNAQQMQWLGNYICLKYGVHVDYNQELATRLRYKEWVRNLRLYELAGTLQPSRLPKPIWVTSWEYWTFTRIVAGMIVDVPLSVYERVVAAKEANLPCSGLVLLKQNLVPVEEKRYEVVHHHHISYVRPQHVVTPYVYLDPCLLWFLPCGEDVAIPLVAGVWFD